MLDLFSTEKVSIHYKMLIVVKDQFDLHKLLAIFFENNTCTLCLVFFTHAFLVKAEQIVILTIKKEKHLVRHFYSNRVDNTCVDCVLSQGSLLLRKII